MERNEKSSVRSIAKLDGVSLKMAIRVKVDKDVRIMTDDWPAYRGIGANFNGGHHVVKHSKGEYSRRDVTNNTVESFFALLKQGVVGTFHSVSRWHLARYCDEFSFRWNHRKADDGLRTALAIQGGDGKRLLYQNLR